MKGKVQGICLLIGLLVCIDLHANTKRLYARINIAGLGYDRLEELKAQPHLAWWVELDAVLLVLTRRSALRSLSQFGAIVALAVPVDEAALVFVGAGHAGDQLIRGSTILAHGGRFSVLQLAPGRSVKDWLLLNDEESSLGCGIARRAFTANSVLAADANNRPLSVTKLRAETQILLDAVDPDRWFEDVTTLASFSRITGSSGLVAAGSWLLEQFSQLPYLEVNSQPFTYRDGLERNIVATLVGTRNPEELYIIGAHYDSIASRDGGLTAPGAEDNASGTAAVLEMARIFNVFRPHATVIFICYSAEEQGFHGSRHHVSLLQDANLEDQVRAVLNMDMISYTSDDDLDVLLETGEIASFLVDAFSAAAANYTSLRVITSLNPSGSDHVPYLQKGMPALLTIEDEYASYPGYHRSTDTPEKLDLTMAREVIKMNIAAMAEMMGFDGLDNPVLFLAE